MSKKILIYYNSRFEGDSLETRPIGGMIFSDVMLTRMLAKKGHSVTMLCNCLREGEYAGVRYLNIGKAREQIEAGHNDILMLESTVEPLQFNVKAGRTIYKTGLHFNAKPIQPLMDRAYQDRIDIFVLKSEWQKRTFVEHFKLDPEKIMVIRNGYDPSAFVPGVKKIKGRLIYFSSPARGLDVIIDIFPRIRKRVKNAELFVFSDYELYGQPKGNAWKRYPNMLKMAAQRGIHMMGNVKKSELIPEVQRAYIMAYPAHFNETSCNAAIEAQAAGTVPVTSRLAALPEAVMDGETGILIPGNSRSLLYKWRFVRKITNLLNDDEKWERMSEAGKKLMKEEYSWERIILQWHDLMERDKPKGKP